MSQNYQYNTIEEALRDLKEGKIVLVTDDPDRENEGDEIELSADGCGEYGQSQYSIYRGSRSRRYNHRYLCGRALLYYHEVCG